MTATEKRCEISELPVSMCAHCKDPDSQRRLRKSDESTGSKYPKISATFRARWDNADGCGECGAEINQDDLAAFIDNALCCIDCVNKAREWANAEVKKYVKKWGKI